MRFVTIFIFTSLIILNSCSSERKERPLSDPGFGITSIDIHAGVDEVEVPVSLKYDEPVKGIQFTLAWDQSQAEISQPIMGSANPSFTISNNQARNGRMKVLIFSMQGGVLDLTNPEIFRIPIEITDFESEEFELRFEDVVFAGPSATSYDIPVTHAKMKILQ